MPIVTVRMNNIYGPNQWDVKLMPKFIKLAFHEQEFTIQVNFVQFRKTRVTLQGSGSQLRSWLYITDAAEGICRVVEDGRVGETYNIGTAFELSVKQVSERIQDEVDRQLGRTPKPQQTHTHYKGIAQITKARGLGQRPTLGRDCHAHLNTHSN